MGLTKSYNKIEDTIKSIDDECNQLEKDLNNIKDQIIELDTVETKSDRGSFTGCLEELDIILNKIRHLERMVMEYEEQLQYEIRHYDFKNPEPEQELNDPNPEDTKESITPEEKQPQK